MGRNMTVINQLKMCYHGHLGSLTCKISRNVDRVRKVQTKDDLSVRIGCVFACTLCVFRIEIVTRKYG